MGFKWGLYGGRNITRITAWWNRSKTSRTWCTDKLSSIAIGQALLPLKDITFGITLPRIKSKKISWSTLAVVSSKPTNPEVQMAAIALVLPLEWKRWTTGVWLRRAYPYFRDWSRASDPVSYIHTNLLVLNVKDSAIKVPRKASHLWRATNLTFQVISYDLKTRQTVGGDTLIP